MSTDLFANYVNSFQDHEEDLERLVAWRVLCQMKRKQRYVRNVTIDIPRTVYKSLLYEHGEREIQRGRYVVVSILRF